MEKELLRISSCIYKQNWNNSQMRKGKQNPAFQIKFKN